MSAPLPPGVVAAGSPIVAMAKKVRQAARKDPSGLWVRSARIENARPFRWAWEQRVLMGYVNLQIGEEGVGKGNLTAWQAARITRGDLEGDLKGKPRKVAFVGDEDAWDHIWVPRLKAADADLRKVKYIEAGLNGTLDVSKDADALGEYIEKQRIALVYFDQLLDNLGFVDSWKDKDVRDALAPIRRVAQETGSAFLCSMHPNKRSGSFRDRISGTPAFNALSRSSLLVAHHPHDEGRRVVVRGKGNYSAEPFGFEFRIEQENLKVGDHLITTSKIVDEREGTLRVSDVLDTNASRRQPDSEIGQARQKLEELFPGDEVRKASDVLELMAAEGFDKRKAQAARRSIGIETWKSAEYQGAWMWGRTRPKIKAKRARKKR